MNMDVKVTRKILSLTIRGEKILCDVQELALMGGERTISSSHNVTLSPYARKIADHIDKVGTGVEIRYYRGNGGKQRHSHDKHEVQVAEEKALKKALELFAKDLAAIVAKKAEEKPPEGQPLEDWFLSCANEIWHELKGKTFDYVKETRKDSE